MSNSTQDGGQATSTPHHQPGTFNVRPGAATQDGTDFEIKMFSLVFLRAVQADSSFTNFTMATNDDDAGGFDDIVFSYESPGNEQKNILVQLKTSNNALNLIAPEKLSLKRYFKTMEKNKYTNCTFVFFSNADVKLKPRVENVDFPAKNSCTALKPADVQTARKLLCTTLKPDDVCQVDLSHDVCEGFRTDPGAEDFVDRLLIFRNQLHPDYLDELIKQEFIKISNGFVSQCHNIQKDFVQTIRAWFVEGRKEKSKEPQKKENKEPQKKERFHKDRKEWTDLKKQLLGQNTLLKGIKFCNVTLSNLEETVSKSESDIILLRSESAEVQLACSKVYQAFITKEDLGVLFTDISEPPMYQDMLFQLWPKDEWDVLVITDVTNSCQNLGERIVNYTGNPEGRKKKKIVIISNRDTKTLGLSPSLVDEIGTKCIRSTFKQLDYNSKALLLNLPVDFQGQRSSLGKIMADRVLEGGLLQDVLTSTKIEIGEALPARDEKYVPRTLSKRLVVSEKILISNDTFFLCCKEEYELKLLIAKAREEEYVNEQWFSEQKHRFNMQSPEEFTEAMSGFKCCAENLSEDPVHFLELTDDSLYWLHSHGSTDNIFKYIQTCPEEEDDCRKLIRDDRSSRATEEDLVRNEIPTVIVGGDPGSGKTALLHEVARNMKELHPHRWIINIDLNKHSDILREMEQLGNVNTEYVIRLLSKAANVDDSELGKQLLQYYLLKSGDICLLFDAFDEIAPMYTKIVLGILELILSDFKLSTLWVSSRFNMTESLEDLLKRKLFRIDRLSGQDQFNFISRWWGEEKAEKFQRQVVEEMPFDVRDAITSFPLHLEMMCEMCDDLVKFDDFSRISEVLNITDLYEKFSEKKWKICIEKKLRSDNPTALMDDIQDQMREYYIEMYMFCSLVVLDFLDHVECPTPSFIKEKVQKLCQQIQNCRVKYGIIDGVVNGEPHFLHRTFAEYFAGKWLAEHWKYNKRLAHMISIDFSNTVSGKTFSQILARELPAHLAVLNGDIDTLKTLELNELNRRDALGRTPLHLAVLDQGPRCKFMVKELVESGVDLGVRDYLLEYTPVHYALESYSMAVVKYLVKGGAHVYDGNPLRHSNILFHSKTR